MGKGVIAQKIIELAVDYNIPVMRNVALAQTLVEKGELYQYIPEETYEAVAEILRWIEGLEHHETIGTDLFK
jgi:flagellar biosynthesis protein FlhB